MNPEALAEHNLRRESKRWQKSQERRIRRLQADVDLLMHLQRSKRTGNLLRAIYN